MAEGLEILRILEVSAQYDDAIERAAEAWNSDLVVMDNDTVYALGGNANNENLQDRIVDVKGELRGSKQPVGWTRPFDERMLDTVDVNRIEGRRLRKFMRDPDELTARLGGLTFIRALADMKAKRRHGVPDCIIPPSAKGFPSAVQIYSPEGMATTTAITRRALALGAETVMTSANVSKVPESITETDARNFIKSSSPDVRPIGTLVVTTDNRGRSRPRGSYPVIVANHDRFIIKRPGCFEPQILRAALAGFTVELAGEDSLDPPKYPHNVLRMQDLPADVRSLKGSEFRLGMLSALGWSRELEPVYQSQ